MSIIYDIHELKNAQGIGAKRKYVQPLMQEPMDEKSLYNVLSNRCTLTDSDVSATLLSLASVIREELLMGCRVHLPGIGYFSVKTSLDIPEGKEKIRSNYVKLDNISFKPETSLLDELKREVKFVRSDGSTRSQEYTEEQMVEQVKAYLAEKPYINSRILSVEFNLRQRKRLYWLNRLVELGVIEKHGPRNAPFYLLVNKAE